MTLRGPVITLWGYWMTPYNPILTCWFYYVKFLPETKDLAHLSDKENVQLCNFPLYSSDYKAYIFDEFLVWWLLKSVISHWVLTKWPWEVCRTSKIVHLLWLSKWPMCHLLWTLPLFQTQTVCQYLRKSLILQHTK